MNDDNVRPLRGKPRAKPPAPTRGAARGRVREPEVAKAREEAVMDLYVRGYTLTAIADQLGIMESTVKPLLVRALEKRADPELARHAREALSARFEAMLRRWMPMALGDLNGVPDEKAAEIVLKVLDRLGKIHGVDVLPPQQTNNFFLAGEDLRDQMRAEVLRSLDEAAERAALVRGTLEREDPPA